MKILRWILVLPISFLAAWAGYYIIAYSLQTFFVEWWLSPDSFIATFLTRVLGSIAMGAFYIISAFKVAPSQSNRSMIVLMAVGIIFCLIFSIVGFFQEDWWAVLNLVLAGITCGLIGWKQYNWQTKTVYEYDTF